MNPNSHTMKYFRQQRGLSLVEIMVALTISAFLMAGVIQVFVSNKESYRVQQSLSRLQENGRFALQMLKDDIRMADFWGCRGIINDVSSDLNPGGAGFIDFTQGGLDGTDNTGLNNTDTLILRGAFSTGLRVLTPFMPTVAAALQVSPNNGLKQSDIVFVSDCRSGDIFQLSNANPDSTGTLVHNTGAVAGDPGNATGDLSKVYGGDATIFAMRQFTYSIQAGVSGQPGLFRSDNGGAAIELIEGVEDMQIVYGEDINGDGTADRYLVAGTAGLDMDRVVSVRVDLTLVTIADNVATATGGADKRIRRDFTATTSIRNRLL